MHSTINSALCPEECQARTLDWDIGQHSSTQDLPELKELLLVSTLAVIPAYHELYWRSSFSDP